MTPRRLVIAVLFLALTTACNSTRLVHLDTGQGQPLIHVPRTDDVKPVELGEEEFRRAIAKELRQKRPPANPEKVARELFEVPHAVAGTGTPNTKESFRWTRRPRLRNGQRWQSE